jgi:ribose transport system ATP-binding protein
MSKLEMKGISKSFSSVKVLEKVDLTIEGGKTVALLGENGAGKSTLIKILTGVYTADEGEISIDGLKVSVNNVDDAKKYGIGIIHQELNLFKNLSIAENFLLGNEKEFKKGIFINYPLLHDRVEKILKQLNLNHHPSTPVSELGVGEQQLVEIGKALQTKVKFLVMDEPTAALTDKEVVRLFEIIKDLKNQGVGIAYISHRMEELYQIADQVTVLRDGRFIATREMNQSEENELIALMVGREVTDRYPKKPSNPGETILKTIDLHTSFVKNVSIEVKAGEIVGIGGLMGSGRTEIARAIAGIDKITSGELLFKSQKLTLKNPIQAIKNGIAFVTEDRKDQGLVLPFSIRENLSLPTLENRTRLGFIESKKEKDFAAETVKKLRIKSSSYEQTVGSLSGGNQQKVVIGKWLAQNPNLLILDEPTRGVDVGAKQEIYELMNEMKAQGKAILMISSDLPELLGMCDRIYVTYEKRLQGELNKEDVNDKSFMTLATGGVLRG